MNFKCTYWVHVGFPILMVFLMFLFFLNDEPLYSVATKMNNKLYIVIPQIEWTIVHIELFPLTHHNSKELPFWHLMYILVFSQSESMLSLFISCDCDITGFQRAKSLPQVMRADTNYYFPFYLFILFIFPYFLLISAYSKSFLKKLSHNSYSRIMTYTFKGEVIQEHCNGNIMPDRYFCCNQAFLWNKDIRYSLPNHIKNTVVCKRVNISHLTSFHCRYIVPVFPFQYRHVIFIM